MKKKNKVILYYNPNSGNGLFKNNLDKIIERYQEAGKTVIFARASEGFSISDFFSKLDKETYKDEYDQILAAGGDGTINLCVNAMIENDIDLPLAILPAGTANDFAYYFGIPAEIDKMLDIALSGNYISADVGKVNDRYFINVAAIGQVVDVSQKTDPTLKNSIGVLAYYLKGMSEIPKLRASRVTIEADGKLYKKKIYFMVVMNGKSAGGFNKISPQSEINDGNLDIIVFESMKFFELPGLFFQILKGKHKRNKNVFSTQASSIRITSEKDLPTDIDGEHGEKLPLEFSVLHNRLRISVL